MAILGNIIKSLEKNLNINIHGGYDANKHIEAVSFLTKKNIKTLDLTDDVLYLGYYTEFKDIKIKRNIILLDNGVEQNLSNYSGFMIIRSTIDIFDLSNEIEKEIIRYQKMKYKREILFEALYSGNGISGLLNTANKYLENPITVCDTSFCIMASSPTLDDARHLDKLDNKLFIKENKIQNMRKYNVISHLHKSSEPLYISLDENYYMVFQSVKIKNNTVAYLFTPEVNKMYNHEDLEYIQVLSQMVSIELQKENIYSQSNSYKYEYFLSELLNGNLTDKKYVQRQLDQIGMKESPYYHILLCSLSNSNTSNLDIQTYCQKLRNLLPNSLVTVHKKYITVLLKSDKINDINFRVEEKLNPFLQLNSMIAGLSYGFDDIIKANSYFEQIRELISLDNIAKIPGIIIKYSDNYLIHLLGDISNINKLYTMMHPHIRNMVYHDRENKTNYVQTIEAFLQNNRNASLAANSLYIHKSTFFYRLNKIIELFDIDINDAELLFNYEYSLRIYRYIVSLGQN